jgi:hypothetical protein
LFLSVFITSTVVSPSSVDVPADIKRDNTEIRDVYEKLTKKAKS